MYISVYKETLDNWRPSYYINGLAPAVEVKLRGGREVWIVSVWGADDTGMCKQFGTLDDAMACFSMLIRWPTVNQYPLETHGFQYA